ncbi:hypothetical protein DTO013E5_3690 [Penicillium roqueforti]|uniref:Genomic scaffold, ProqFM164S02 n=1 Tax=Penicillium roqueforti (strain FM164) TaxID=1365484 RepID=W6Q7U1_PENRF|nr:hypothetical protein CBS147337_8516 [Penicillium roqueforti]CDM32081.1 unnamed protein product [Penicillium roqueforti FM164]KAI2735796.1 hypothetical protein DTO012A1_8877 [Penicillium roqueforti]KAI2752427.1 hypothetical protein DTO013F2_3230 [Penicillium roqueforti]KAI3085094.1 hypothetical protein CBS147339_1344 [Penicillium roqueforti]
MPFPATPSPFRLARRNPSTRRSGPQFASTPRFLLSQSVAQKEDDDLDLIDDDGPSSTRKVASNLPVTQTAPGSRQQRDVIEDSDDAAGIGDVQTGGRDADELPDDAINSTPPEEAETPGILDAEFDALFSPVRDGNKRRRVEGVAPSHRRNLTHIDPILSSPPESVDPPADPIALSDKSRQSTTAWDMGMERNPAPSACLFAQAASTPSNMKTPFRSRPRFMLSSAARPPSSQSAPRFKLDEPGISPSERRKPVFVLPRSPSPNPDAEDIPAPFSPSSRTLHRRGRNRAGVSNYIPGGMAAEARGWILEMGTKRDQLPKPPLGQASDSPEKPNAYLLTARVIHVSQSSMSGCGSLAFLQAELLTGNHIQGRNPDSVLNIMIMGTSRSKSVVRQNPSRSDAITTPQLRKGDLVGIHKGLNWSLELGNDSYERRSPGQVSGYVSERGPSDNGGSLETKEGWLIAMEWDLIGAAE